MKKFEYKRINTVKDIEECREAGRKIDDTEEILNFYCANRNSEWELVTVAFDGNGHEIIYLRKEVKW